MSEVFTTTNRWGDRHHTFRLADVVRVQKNDVFMWVYLKDGSTLELTPRGHEGLLSALKATSQIKGNDMVDSNPDTKTKPLESASKPASKRNK